MNVLIIIVPGTCNLCICIAAFAAVVVAVDHFLYITGIVQYHGKAIPLQEKCAGTEIAHEPCTAVPLAFVLNEFKIGLCR